VPVVDVPTVVERVRGASGVVAVGVVGVAVVGVTGSGVVAV
jgi:hypothetical protein